MIVLVDDHSDHRARQAADAVVDHMRADGQPFTLLRHEHNRGKGAALQTGFDAILAAGGAEDDLVLIQDADLEYDPADYPACFSRFWKGRPRWWWARGSAATGPVV